MKKIKSVSILFAVFLLAISGSVIEASDIPADQTEGIFLNELDYFEKDSWFSVTSGGEDSFGNAFHYQLHASRGAFDTNQKSITYYLGRQYSSLTGQLFIPKRANSTTSGHGLNWDTAAFTIYQVDENGNQTTLYKKNNFTNMMKPESVTVDLSDVEFLKIEFLDCVYSDTGLSEPLVSFGDPMLY